MAGLPRALPRSPVVAHRLRVVSSEPGSRLCDVEAIALHYGVAKGTIRRWASEDRWTPFGTRRRRLWSLRDAQKSFERRHPPTPWI